jgi:hypothetical protein
VVAFTKSEGHFLIQKLPAPVQFSCINKIAVTDINSDGKKDLVIGGNQFGFLPQFSRLDASYGNILLGTGSGNFSSLSSKESGLKLTGQVRDIVDITGVKQRFLLFLQNDELPVLYKIK